MGSEDMGLSEQSKAKVDAPPVTTCAFKLKREARCKRRVASGQRFCWQHSHGWKAKWRSLSRSQTAGLFIGLAGIVITLVLGVPPLWRMSFPPHPIAYVEVNDTLGRGNYRLLAQGTTNLPFDQRGNRPAEILFYVRNTGSESLKKPVYAVLTNPSDICRVVEYPQFGETDLRGCRGASGAASMTPDLPYLGAAKERQKPLPQINGMKDPGANVAISTDTDSFRQVLVKLTIPSEMSKFYIQLQVSGENLSFSVYNIQYGILR